MTDITGFILALWLLAELNFLRFVKVKTTADFNRTREEEREWRDVQRDFQRAEVLYRRAERDRKKLDTLIAKTRRRKDGHFDERTKAGRMLNREIPRLSRARREALAKKKACEGPVLRLEEIPEIRRDRWVRAESLRGACRHGVVVLPVLVALDAGRFAGENLPQGVVLLLLWSGIAAVLSLKYVYSTRKELGV